MRRTGWQWLVFVGVLAVLIGLHLPFLDADGDASLGFSRGPWTDEGLYTAQVRNAMRTGVLDLAESDGVVKEPLFSLFAWGVLKGFGDSMMVMRMGMLVLSSALLAWLASGRLPLSRSVLVALPVLALSYYPFHYAHLALVEVTAGLLIMGALWCVQHRMLGGGRWTWGLSALLIFVAYGMKIQFVYAAVIPPLAFALAWALNADEWRLRWRAALVDVCGSSVAALLMAAVYVLAWYWPQRALVSFVLGAQTSRRSSSWTQVLHSLADNVHMLLADRRLWVVWLVLLVGMVAGAAVWRTKQRHGAWLSEPALKNEPDVTLQRDLQRPPDLPRQFWIQLAPPAAWVLIELHKLTLSYLPSRYFLTLVMSLGLLGATGLVLAWQAAGRDRKSSVWQGDGPSGTNATASTASTTATTATRGTGGTGGTIRARWPHGWRMAPAAVLAVVLVLDARDYAKALERRTYVIRDAQQLLARQGGWDGQLVIGPWAATLFWGTGAITKPVWKDYFNDGETLRQLRPLAIVSESDQEDSEGAFRAAGVTLVEPPMLTVKIQDWTVKVHPSPAGGQDGLAALPALQTLQMQRAR